MSDFGSVSLAFVAGIAATVVWTNASEPDLIKEASMAQKDGRTISNEMMEVFYPKTYRQGQPAYLERDFEAGADLICDEIFLHYGNDLCSQEPIRWR